jgi:hypothetical protein
MMAQNTSTIDLIEVGEQTKTKFVEQARNGILNSSLMLLRFAIMQTLIIKIPKIQDLR